VQVQDERTPRYVVVADDQVAPHRWGVVDTSKWKVLSWHQDPVTAYMRAEDLAAPSPRRRRR
jgi:hypothetical protein